MNEPNPHGGFVAHAADGVAILLWAADPERPALLATPFVHAAAAAALELPVEMYFTARSVHLLVPGVAARLRASERHDRNILQVMQQAVAHGAKLYACTDALHAQGLGLTPLIAECAGHGGAVQFMARAGDLRWRALVF
jgi:predicted peroxiredoxin